MRARIALAAALAAASSILALRLWHDAGRARRREALAASRESALASIRQSAEILREARRPPSGATAEFFQVELPERLALDVAPAILEASPEALPGGWIRRSWHVEFHAIGPVDLRAYLLAAEESMPGLQVAGLELAFPSPDAPDDDLYRARAILVHHSWQP